MIRIKFEEPQTTVWRRWLKDCEAATNDLKNAYDNKQRIEFTDLYKRKSIKETVYLAKDGLFRGICAYCEADIADFQHGDIDHYRPKGAATDENRAPALVRTDDGKELRHPGYYWLAYKWTNLLPTCITCNQPGAEGIGKHDRFPVQDGKYALREEDLAHEKPLFFNPIDAAEADPADHLGVDPDSGLMTIKNGSRRADICIKIFGLNIRDQLVRQRREAMLAVKAHYALMISGTRETAMASCHELDLMEEGKFSHTLARRAQMQELKERRGRH